MKKILPKILVILGPTASGKTSLALELAKKYDGEIVSMDSRQVYKKMRIGTDKPVGEWKRDPSVPQDDNKGKFYIVKGIPHYMMDIYEPDEEFSLADFKEQAVKYIKDILKRGKLPILAGGTGLYIEAIIDNMDIPTGEPDKKLRVELANKSLGELQKELKEKDLKSYKVIDIKNPHRVVRALEVAIKTGKSFVDLKTKSDPIFDALQIGIKLDREVMYEKINKRVDKMIEEGLIEEVRGLVDSGFQYGLQSMSGIGYKQIGYFLKGEMSLAEAIELLKRDTRRYAKRQVSWFKRDERIEWVEGIDETEELVKKFLLN